MRRRALAAALLVSVLVAGACGGGSRHAATTAADASTVLDAVSVGTPAPAQVNLTATVTLDGQPTDPALAFIGSGPLELRATGASGGADGTFDGEAQLHAGPIALPVGLRSDGTTAWLRVGEQWYTAAGGGASALDPTALLGALGDPSAWLRDAKVVGDEQVEGIPATHVTGSVDPARVAPALARLLASAQGTVAGLPAVDEQTLAAAITKADAELWIGTDDHQVHRLVLDLGLTAPPGSDTRGVTGATVAIDVTSVPGPAPTVVAPANALPLSELGASLAGRFGLAGGGQTG